MQNKERRKSDDERIKKEGELKGEKETEKVGVEIRSLKDGSKKNEIWKGDMEMREERESYYRMYVCRQKQNGNKEEEGKKMRKSGKVKRGNGMRGKK